MNNHLASTAGRNFRSASVSTGNSANLSRLVKLACAGVALTAAPSAFGYLPPGNLLVNGDALSPLAPAWTTSYISSADSGWGISGFLTGSGKCFITSYVGDSRYQIVDLMPAGTTAADLDASPELTVSEHVCASDGVNFNNNGGSSNGDGATGVKPDQYYLKVQLLAADKTTVLAEQDMGASNALVNVPSTTFDFVTNKSLVSFKFASKSYPSGVRYVRFEDGGKDGGNWAGQYGAAFTKARVEFTQDTDGDGMPDAYEVINGLDPTVNDASGDLDNDGLTNIQEYLLGTKANNADTDGDGLKDGVETKTGFYVDPTNTGTDPLNPDTDGDGLLDGYENYSVNGLDPTIADTDGDGFSDGVEVLLGSDPTNPSSTPVFTDIMHENFDGSSLNSTYALSHNGTGTYVAGVFAAGAPNNNVLRLNSNVGNVSNSIAFDQFPSNAKAVRIEFDFRMTAGADGIGFGLYKTSAYPATGALNPAFNTTAGAAFDDHKWEDPTAGSTSGVTDSVGFGFGIYNGSTFIMNGPAAPGQALVKNKLSTGSFSNAVFNHVSATGITDSAGATNWTVQITFDVNGSPTTQTLASVKTTGFDITADAYRLVFGSRSGGSVTTADIDNIKVSSAGTVTAPKVAPVITSTSYTAGASPSYVINWKSTAGATYKIETSTDLSTWTTVTGMATVASGGATTTATIPQASTLKKGFFRVTTN